MEQQRKGLETTIKNLRVGFGEDVEQMTEMFSRASKDLLKLTKEHKELQSKFDAYYQKSEEYIKDRESKITALENELAEIKHNFATFDEKQK